VGTGYAMAIECLRSLWDFGIGTERVCDGAPGTALALIVPSSVACSSDDGDGGATGTGLRAAGRASCTATAAPVVCSAAACPPHPPRPLLDDESK
jgi:hypothetical protein